MEQNMKWLEKKEIMKRNSYYCTYNGKISNLESQSFIGIDLDNEIIDKRKKSKVKIQLSPIER